MWLTTRRLKQRCLPASSSKYTALIIALLCLCPLAASLDPGDPTASASANKLAKQQDPSAKTEAVGRLRAPRRSKTSGLMPEFSAPIGNVTAVLGRDVRLVCTIEHLGQYQVAWLKEESKTILSIDTNIITTNYRIFLIPDEEERKWVLHIKDVQASDRGLYQCQVNTIPMRSTSGYLEVVVPPTIIESQSSQVVEVIEHSNVSLQCKADGHPRPSVTWRRDDGAPIRLNGRQDDRATSGEERSQQPLLDEVKSDKLSLYNVDRSMAGIYVCTASNGIPSQTGRRIPVYVKFAPKTSITNKYVAVSLGDQLEVDCMIEAFPKSNNHWSKKSPHTQRGRLRYSQADRRAISSRAKQPQPPLQDLASGASQQNGSSTFRAPTAPDNGSPKNQGKLQQVTAVKPIAQQHAIQIGHPHNRIQFRQVDQGDLLAERGYQPFEGSLIGELDSSRTQPSASAGDTYVTVKQTAINSYTYKLKLTITSVQADDYGEYACIATSSMGTSESHVIVTKADKTGESGSGMSEVSSEYRSVEENGAEFQRDSLDTRGTNQLLHRKGQHVVYDENYLQAIKTRQSNLLSSVKSNQQQKLKLKQKNSASGGSLVSHVTVILICPNLLLLHLLVRQILWHAANH